MVKAIAIMNNMNGSLNQCPIVGENFEIDLPIVSNTVKHPMLHILLSNVYS